MTRRAKDPAEPRRSAPAASPAPAKPPPFSVSSALGPDLRLVGRILDDCEQMRIQTTNRIGAAERAIGEPLPHLYYILDPIAEAEKRAVAELKLAWRKHPLRPWQQSYLGLGEKSAARLLAIIGDPADRPNIAKLWAYCGVGDPLRIRRRGMTQAEALRLGNPWAGKQLHVIAECLLKAGNRAAYDDARDRYRDALHERACVRCGPAGQPALPGSALSDGHKHARGLRALKKQFLLDLWLAAKAVRA